MLLSLWEKGTSVPQWVGDEGGGVWDVFGLLLLRLQDYANTLASELNFCHFFFARARCLSPGLRSWGLLADQQGIEPPPAVCQRRQKRRPTNWATRTPSELNFCQASLVNKTSVHWVRRVAAPIACAFVWKPKLTQLSVQSRANR